MKMENTTGTLSKTGAVCVKINEEAEAIWFINNKKATWFKHCENLVETSCKLMENWYQVVWQEQTNELDYYYEFLLDELEELDWEVKDELALKNAIYHEYRAQICGDIMDYSVSPNVGCFFNQGVGANLPNPRTAKDADEEKEINDFYEDLYYYFKEIEKGNFKARAPFKLDSYGDNEYFKNKTENEIYEYLRENNIIV